MMNKTEISLFQLAFILIHAQIGVGVITLPYDVFVKAHGDAWISIIIAGVILQIILILYYVLIRRFPSSNLYEIIQNIFGKVIGNTIIVFYCFFYICVGIIVLAKYTYFLRAWMMPLTPRWLLVGLMVFLAVYIIKDHVQIIARFSVLTSIVLTGFIAVSFYSFKFANITYILPVGVNGIMPIIKGLPPSMFSFQGFELLLVFYPFVRAEPKAILKVASFSNVFVTLFYTLLVFVSLTVFSPEELKITPEPVLYLVKSFSFRIIERPDLLFTSMWIVLVATTFICLLFVTTIGTTTFVNSTKLGRYALVIGGVCLIGGTSLQGIFSIESVSKFINHFVVPLLYGLPLIILLISMMLKKKEEVKK